MERDKKEAQSARIIKFGTLYQERQQKCGRMDTH